MADRKGLRRIGYLLGAATAAVALIATLFVANVEPGTAEQAATAFSSSNR